MYTHTHTHTEREREREALTLNLLTIIKTDLEARLMVIQEKESVARENANSAMERVSELVFHHSFFMCL